MKDGRPKIRDWLDQRSKLGERCEFVEALSERTQLVARLIVVNVSTSRSHDNVEVIQLKKFVRVSHSLLP